MRRLVVGGREGLGEWRASIWALESACEGGGASALMALMALGKRRYRGRYGLR